MLANPDNKYFYAQVLPRIISNNYVRIMVIDRLLVESVLYESNSQKSVLDFCKYKNTLL